MGRVLIRKLILLIVLVPLLNALSFAYASTFGRNQIRDQFAVEAPGEAVPAFGPAYRTYLQNLFTGDLGTLQRVPIATFVSTPLRNSFILLGLALGVIVVLGPLLGVGAISPRTSRIRSGVQALLTVGSTLPGFFLGSALIIGLLYASRWGLYNGPGTWLPIQGFGLDKHLILPLITLAARPILYVGYLTAGLLEHELQQDYVRVARSKGLGWWALVWRHALPNIVASVVVALGQSLRLLASGLILVEALFDWPGIGRLFLGVVALNESGSPSPYFLEPPLLALIVVVFGVLLLLTDLIASLIAHAVDPRLRGNAQQPAVA